MSKAVIILSGGMDSTTLLYQILSEGYETSAISFDYNQKHKKELMVATKTCQKFDVPHKIINLSILNELAPSSLTRDDWEVPEGHYADENMKETVVPNRNMVMLSLATSYAIGIKANEVFYGAHSGDHDIYPDCRKEYVKQLSKTIEMCDWHKIKLVAPFLNIDKGDIVIKGQALNVDYSLTWTCYKGKDKACGKCGSCTERLEAFDKAGTKDPLKYDEI
jgi:7-cyano-7-deazaguanine synthase|tara:strand:+ start:271 stop:930 length:660 start_codon:yes stop_codon:yes gene_type:complete